MNPLHKSTCEVCGTAMPSNAPMGMCPACLMKSGVFSPKGKSTTVFCTDTGNELKSGLRLGGGRFSLVDLLGEGGMGVVWLAIDEGLSKAGEPFYVALKFLAPQIRSDPRALALMREEVLRSRQLRHPRIISIYDWHTLTGEPVFISMEYVEGVNLSQLLEIQPARFMAWPVIAPWVRQLCVALDYAHTEERIIHRDLKPANLMLNQRSELKLADFGLAAAFKRADETQLEETRARGTPLYMSPQQMAGKPPHPTDDVYSLGATLYELLTSTPPFYTGEDIFKQVIHDPAEPIGDRLVSLGYKDEIPTRVKMVLAACLQKNAANRPQSVREIAHRLGLDAVDKPEPARVFAPALASEAESFSSTKPRSSVPWMPLVLLLMVAMGYVFRQSAPMQALIQRVYDVARSVFRTEGRTQPPPPSSAPSRLVFITDPPDTQVSLVSLGGVMVQSARLAGTNSGQFTNVVPGRYKLFAGKDEFNSTNLIVDLRPGRTDISLTLSPLRPASPTANTLVLSYPFPAPIHFRLLDASQRRVESTFVRETPVAELALGTCYVEAGISNLEQTAFRIYQRTEIVPGLNRFAIDFNKRGVVHIIVNTDPNDPAVDRCIQASDERFITALDHWGVAAQVPLTPNLPRGWHGWHRNARPGEWTYRLSFPPNLQDAQTNLPVRPGTTETISIAMTEDRGPRPGFPWVNSLDMTLVWFPEPKPGFWACTTETARQQYKLFADSNPGEPPQGMVEVTAQGWQPRTNTWRDPGFETRDVDPVVGVSWDDAMRFCLWLTEREQGRLHGKIYSLPDDQQWSAMAGDTTFPWGTNWPPTRTQANCAGEEVRASPDWFPYWPCLEEHEDLWARLAPVQSAQANPFGLFHLAGNVAEWCDSDYRPDLNDPAVLKDYPRLTNVEAGETYKVVRGGSWFDHHPDELRTKTRVPAKPAERNDRTGFRVILINDVGLAR